MDPLELRRKNEASPVRAAQYDLGAKAIGWERRNKKAGDTPGPEEARDRDGERQLVRVRRRERRAPRCKVHRDGSVELVSGCQDIGTGFRTAIAVVAAEELGIEPDDVTIAGRRHPVPRGPGLRRQHHRPTRWPRWCASPRTRRETKLFALAAPLLGVDAGGARRREREDLRGGRPDEARSPSSRRRRRCAARSIDCTGEAQEAVRDLPRRPRGHAVRRGRGGHRDRRGARPQDGLGQRLRPPREPLTAQNQVIGAMIQGVSWALLENRILDRNVGHDGEPQPRVRTRSSPPPTCSRRSRSSPPSPTSATTPRPRASASRRSSPPSAAIANAVYNATGARVRELPITPDRVLAALAEAKRRA